MSNFRDRLERKREEYDRTRQERALADEHRRQERERQRSEEARIRDEQVAEERRRLLAAEKLQPIIAGAVREMAEQAAPLLPEDSANTSIVSASDESFLGSLLKKRAKKYVALPGWVLQDTRYVDKVWVDWPSESGYGSHENLSVTPPKKYRTEHGLVIDKSGGVLAYSKMYEVEPYFEKFISDQDQGHSPDLPTELHGVPATNDQIATLDKITPETDGLGVPVDIAMWEQRFLDLMPER